MAGSGNAYGSGVYFSTNLQEAKGYCQGNGVYLKCLIRSRRTCTWNRQMQAAFEAWCKKKNAVQDQNARSAFLLQSGHDTLRTGSIVVVLRPQFSNPSAHKARLHQVRILGVYRGDTDKKLKV
jgi:hypothetical protein